MRRRRKRTEITVETERVFTIRHCKGSHVTRCSICTGHTMAPVEQAAAIAGVTCRTLYRWLEADKVHFAEGADGLVLICLDSVLFHKHKGGLQ